MAVRLKASIGAMALIPVMMMLHCSFLPLEPPGPAHPNLVISASSSGGDFVCSSNAITIYGNGKVVYESGSCFSPDHKEAEITQERIENIVNLFHENNFFSFNDNYGNGGFMSESIVYNDKPVIKSFRVSSWICDTIQVRSSDSVVCPGGPGDPCITFSRYSARLRLSGPPGYDTIFHECWKIKEELFP